MIAVGVDVTRALVFSQVVLSFGIPFALVPLVLLTRRRDAHGRPGQPPGHDRRRVGGGGGHHRAEPDPGRAHARGLGAVRQVPRRRPGHHARHPGRRHRPERSRQGHRGLARHGHTGPDAARPRLRAGRLHQQAGRCPAPAPRAARRSGRERRPRRRAPCSPRRRAHCRGRPRARRTTGAGPPRPARRRVHRTPGRGRRPSRGRPGR